MLGLPSVRCIPFFWLFLVVLGLTCVSVQHVAAAAPSSDPEQVMASSLSSSTFLVWQFCHFSRGLTLDWSVSTTGLLVTSPLYLQADVSRQVAFYSVLSISGARTQTTGNSSESQLLTGMVGYGKFQNNDNVLMSGGSAVLSPTGISYQLDRAVAVPGSTFPQTSINLYMFNSPPIENDQDKDSIGLAYFVFSPGNTDAALPCPPPATQLYSFTYYSAPSTYSNGLFSTCSSGTFSVLGPYSYQDHATGAQKVKFIAENATGLYVFANRSSTQRLQITGVSASGGADFTLYSAFPFADIAGITMTLSGVSQAPGHGVPWLQITSPDSAVMVESGLYGGDNRMDIQVSPLDPTLPPVTCPAAVSAVKWDFCFTSTGTDSRGRWAVRMNGTLLSTANMNLSEPSYYVTAALGQRVQVDSNGAVTLTAISGVQPYNGDLAEPNDNRLYVHHPTLSTAGITLFFSSDDAPVQLPLSSAQPVRFTTLAGSPTMERFVAPSGVDYSSFVYQRSADQFDIQQPSALLCGLPSQYEKQLTPASSRASNSSTAPSADVPSLLAGDLVTLYFYYAAVPSDGESDPFGASWSVCSEGSLSAIGPYSYGANEVYQVIAVEGTRLFLDQFGASSSSALSGVSLVDGANQLLYVAAPGVDDEGLTFTMRPNPLFANVDSNTAYNWVTLSNGSGETTAFAVPNTNVTFLFSTDPSTIPSCVWPGATLQISQNGPVMLLAAGIALCGYFLAMLTVELTYVAFRRRQLGTMVAWLSLTSAAFSLPTWAAIATYYASIDIQCAECTSRLTVAYRLDELLLALLPSVLCVTAALLAMLLALRKDEELKMRDRVHPSTSTSTSTTSGSLDKSVTGATLDRSMIRSSVVEFGPTDEQAQTQSNSWLSQQRTKAMQTYSRLRASVTIYLLPVVVLMAMTLVLTRYTLASLLVLQADISSLPVVDAMSSVLVLLLSSLALLWFFFAPHYRFMAPVLLTAALLLDCELHFVSNRVSYQPHLAKLPSSSIQISFTSLLVVTGLTGLFHLAAIVSTAIHRQRMSRRLLAARMQKTTKKLNTAQSLIHAQKKTIDSLTVIGLEAVKAIDSIAALRPIQADSRGQQSDAQRRAMAASLLWSSLLKSSSTALLDCALHRSARLVAPLLFSPQPPHQLVRGSSVTQSRTAQLGPPRASFDQHLKSVWGAVAHAEPTHVPRLSVSGSPQDGHAPRSSAAEDSRSAVPETSLTSTRDQSGAPWDLDGEPALMAGLRKLLPPTASSEAQEQDHLLRLLNALPNSLTEAAVVKELLFSTARGNKHKEATAALTSIAIAACAYLPTLPHVLSHPVTTELLKDHMQQAASVENILFLARLAQWKDVQNESLKRSLASLMLDEFVRDGSNSQINIPSTQRDLLISAIAKERGTLAADVFLKAEKEVLSLVLTNNWKGFTRTPAYSMCRAVLVRNAIVLTALQLRDGTIAVPQPTEHELNVLQMDTNGDNPAKEADEAAGGAEEELQSELRAETPAE